MVRRRGKLIAYLPVTLGFPVGNEVYLGSVGEEVVCIPPLTFRVSCRQGSLFRVRRRGRLIAHLRLPVGFPIGKEVCLGSVGQEA